MVVVKHREILIEVTEPISSRNMDLVINQLEEVLRQYLRQEDKICLIEKPHYDERVYGKKNGSTRG